MKKKQSLNLSALMKNIEMIPDPRRSWGNLRHKLVDILVIVLLGTICGCTSWEEIEDYGDTKKEWLGKFLELPHGVPSADTYRRLVERISPKSLEQAYRNWVTPYIGGCLQKQISLDGKTIRGASLQNQWFHIVSAWVREDGITLGQIKTDEKSNEINAIPELLNTLDIRGGVVTIDAMGCQKAIARQIIDQEANYVLALKRNQPTLYDEVSEYFTWAREDEIERGRLDTFEHTEKSRGRICTRKITTTTEVNWFEGKSEWTALRTFVMIERRTVTGDQTTEETQYFISSLQASAERFHQLIRGHWSIENQLHWVLDATFREDDSHIQTDHSPENLSILRKIALALLKRDSSTKASLRRKQNIAGWDNQFLESLFLE